MKNELWSSLFTVPQSAWPLSSVECRVVGRRSSSTGNAYRKWELDRAKQQTANNKQIKIILMYSLFLSLSLSSSRERGSRFKVQGPRSFEPWKVKSLHFSASMDHGDTPATVALKFENSTRGLKFLLVSWTGPMPNATNVQPIFKLQGNSLIMR